MDASVDESDDSVSESSDSVIASRNESKGRKKEGAVLGLDSSMGKESELFGVDLKNVNNLEKGLAPPNLGKRTITMFLEQIDDVTAYPRHANHKTNESLGDFVEAVADMHQHCQGR